MSHRGFDTAGKQNAAGRGQAIAPTMDALRWLTHRRHSRGDGSRIRGMMKAVLALGWGTRPAAAPMLRKIEILHDHSHARYNSDQHRTSSAALRDRLPLPA